MHGQHLHGSGIALEPPAALRRRDALGVDHPFGEPGDQRVQAQGPLDGGPVQGLGQVAQIGQAPLTPARGQQPALEPGPAAEQVEGGGEPGLLEPSTGLPGQRADLVEHPVTRLGQAGRRPSDQGGERGEAHPGSPVRLLERLQEPEPVPGTGRGEDAGAARDDRGHPGGVQRSPDEAQLGTRAHEHGDVTGAHGAHLAPDLDRGLPVEQAHDVRGDVTGNRGAQRGEGGHLAGHRADGGAGEDSEPQRHRTGHARRRLHGIDVPDDDLGVPQGSAAVEVLERPQE